MLLRLGFYYAQNYAGRIQSLPNTPLKNPAYAPVSVYAYKYMYSFLA